MNLSFETVAKTVGQALENSYGFRFAPSACMKREPAVKQPQESYTWGYLPASGRVKTNWFHFIFDFTKTDENTKKRNDILALILKTIEEKFGIIAEWKTPEKDGVSEHSCGHIFCVIGGTNTYFRFETPFHLNEDGSVSRTQNDGIMNEIIQLKRLTKFIRGFATSHSPKHLFVGTEKHGWKEVDLKAKELVYQNSAAGRQKGRASKSDIAISCLNNDMFISLKAITETTNLAVTYQQYGGISEKEEPAQHNHPDTLHFIETIRRSIGEGGFFPSLMFRSKNPVSREVAMRAIYGREFGMPQNSPHNVDYIIQGNINLSVHHIDKVCGSLFLDISAEGEMMANGEYPESEDFRPYYYAQFAQNHRSEGIRCCRMNIMPYGIISSNAIVVS